MRSMTGKPRVSAAGLLALALALSACGSSGDDGDANGSGGASTGPSSGGATSAAPTGSPINIGVMVEATGLNSSSTAQVPDVAQAWGKWINATGGIAGHPVKVIVGDSGGIPAQGSAKVHELVEQDRVVAFAGGGDTSAEGAYATYQQQQGIPTVGGSGYTQPWFSNPYYFPLGLDGVGTALAASDLVKKSGVKRLSHVACAEVAACAFEDPIIATLEGSGTQYGSLLRVSQSAPNYTAQCLAMKQDGTDAVFLSLNSTIIAKFINNCAQQNYNPTYFIGVSSYDSALTSLPAATKIIADIHGAPWVSDAPPVKEMNDALKKYGNLTIENASGSQSWAALQTLRDAILAGGATASSDVTKETVLNGLYSFKDYDGKGLLAQKMTFTKGKNFGHVLCYFVGGVEKGKLTAPQGITPNCVTVPASLVGKI